jgi:hypothetical protein
MSTITVTNIKATGETVSRPVSGVAAMFINISQGTPAIQKSLNVSSIVDNGSESTSTNYTNSFSDAVYITTYGHREGGGENDFRGVQASTTSGYYTSSTQRCFGAYVSSTSGGGSPAALDEFFLVSHGDLA